MSGKAVRETLGFLAVVAGLVFVGLEIRQNTAVARAEAYRDIAIFTTEMVNSMSEDREWIALYERIRRGEIDFTPEEMRLAIWRFDGLFRHAEMIWRQVENGVLPQSAMALVLEGALGSAFARQTWPINRVDFPEDFAAFIDERMAREDGG